MWYQFSECLYKSRWHNGSFHLPQLTIPNQSCPGMDVSGSAREPYSFDKCIPAQHSYITRSMKLNPAHKSLNQSSMVWRQGLYLKQPCVPFRGDLPTMWLTACCDATMGTVELCSSLMYLPVYVSHSDLFFLVHRREASTKRRGGSLWQGMASRHTPWPFSCTYDTHQPTAVGWCFTS